MAEEIHKHRESLMAKNIARRFPDLADLPKRKMLFFDIETSGLGFASQIVSLALAHVHHESDIHLQCLFARNPFEEKTVLQYFLDLLPNYEAFFSYNGKAFDAPRINVRAINNGLYERNRKKLKELLNGNLEVEKHHDLYHIIQQGSRIILPDARLKTLEKIVFHYRRQNDIESEDIPKAYYEYVYGRRRLVRKIPADIEVWRKCLAQAETKRDSRLDKKVQDELVRSFAQGLYQGMFVGVEVPEDLREFTEVKGGYREEYYPGEKIDEEERKNDMARLINHNIIDVVSLVAILCRLCSPHPSAEIKIQTPPESKDSMPLLDRVDVQKDDEVPF
jgi:uncharacterized protein YprB with RNaseH-like and TPR domain